ncbi:hypothetical protein ACK3TF_003852 [Chlorella vulgaris]
MQPLVLAACLLAFLAPRWAGARPAGDFTSTIMVHNGTSSRPLSLADGHLLLADSAARACGYSASVFGDQRKLVLSYWAGPDSGPRSFSLCNSADFMQNMWLLTCPRPLETRDGADAAAEGCWCALPTAHHPCDTGAYGFQLTADTRPGHWYYLVIQANPPETGSDPSRSFTLTTAALAAPPPAPALATTPEPAPADDTSDEAAAGSNQQTAGAACNDSDSGSDGPSASADGSQRVCAALL